MKRASYALDAPGERVFLLGNEAIARGAVEAGVKIATGYPGTPSTEIIETVAKIAKYFPEIYVEWAINEKVAFETAFGGSMCGLRAMACMKHVGVNVAADAFVTACYAGARGGLILVDADDPNCYSSQNEQDNRLLAKHAFCPVFEPSNAHEAKEMIKFAFDFSEKFETVVMLRSTTRLSHSKGDVTLGEINRACLARQGTFDHNKARWTFLPVNARTYRKIMLERFKKIEEEVNHIKFNQLHRVENAKQGIIVSGLPYSYVIDFLRETQLTKEVSYLKIATSFPPPRALIEELIKDLDRVLVVEELEPFIEEYIYMYAKAINPNLEIVGKALLPRNGELSPQIVETAIKQFLGKDIGKKKDESGEILEPISCAAPPRPPVLCAGCPHRACFYSLKLAEKRAKKKFIFSSDIGCYTLGFYPPLETIETCLCMGGSIGMAHGIAKSGDPSPVFAILGDGTFFHGGIPELTNLVYNKSPVNVLVLDNLATAMTGFQPHPGTGTLVTGEETKRIAIEEIGKGVGVEFIRVFNPYDLKAAMKVILEAIEYTEGPTLLISRQPCAILSTRAKKQKGEKLETYFIDLTICNKCRLCTSTFGCPAFHIDDETNVVKIVESLCVGCGVCADICPEEAIKLNYSNISR
ncbi:MAG: indolepyruvate ferredoxin oxidoreductase subunit alpha [Candidatus Helarchaeota archaeon]